MENDYSGSSRLVDQVQESDRVLALLSHVLTLFFSFIPPLVIYLVKKDESHFVREHARESLNFQITLAIAYIISFILVFVFVGLLMLMAVGLAHLVLVIVATVKAAENKPYRYPFSIRLVN